MGDWMVAGRGFVGVLNFTWFQATARLSLQRAGKPKLTRKMWWHAQVLDYCRTTAVNLETATPWGPRLHLCITVAVLRYA